METPTFLQNMAVSNSYSMDNTIGIGGLPNYQIQSHLKDFEKYKYIEGVKHSPSTCANLTIKTETEMPAKEATRRIVKIFIIDPDTNIDLKDAVLYQGPEELTDLTDQELFFELDIKNLLKDHNEKRVKILNKKATEKAGKDVFLDAIKVRDLTMVVNVVLEF